MTSLTAIHANFRRPARALLFASFSCLSAVASLPAVAATVDTLSSPDIVMTVNGRAYGMKPVEIMLDAARSTKAEATLPQMLDSLAENQLLAGQARKEYKKEELFPSTRVGIPWQILLEDQYTTMLRSHYKKELDAFVKAQPGGNLNGLITKMFKADEPAIKELTTLRDIGEVRLTPKQEALAKKTVVATYRMPDGSTGSLTFFEIYARMTVQNRVKVIQDHDTAFLEGQVKNRLDSLFVNWWVAAKSGMTKADIELLRTMLDEKALKQQYLTEAGVISEMHEDKTPTMAKLEKQVTKKEIADWYAANKQLFVQIEKVRARNIECRDEDGCKKALAEYKGGKDFSEVAKLNSIAANHTANPAGTLGWIERKNNTLGWLGEVAMIGKQGQVIGPIREPADNNGNANWQLVLIDERVDGYLPPESDAVAAQAREEIAKKRAVDRFKALREKLLKSADIRRNGKMVQAYGAPKA